MTPAGTEIHRSNHNHQLPSHNARHLDGSCPRLSTQFAKWWSGIPDIWQYICNCWNAGSCLINGGNGFHVRGNATALMRLLTETRDPVVGAQYRWSASLAPKYPKFWGLIQGMHAFWSCCFVRERLTCCRMGHRVCLGGCSSS